MLRLPLLAFLLAACGADPSPLPPDAARDAAPDVTPDAPPAVDVVADEPAPPPDLPAPDASAPDASPPAPDDGPDAAPDARADSGPDAPRDVAGELADARPDADPLLEQATALRVTVQSGENLWASADRQSCLVEGGRLSVGAEYSAPFRSTFVAEGPLSGPAVLGTDTRSTVLAEVWSRPAYTPGGPRRMNFRVGGTIGETYLELTAIGCEVR